MKTKQHLNAFSVQWFGSLKFNVHIYEEKVSILIFKSLLCAAYFDSTLCKIPATISTGVPFTQMC